MIKIQDVLRAGYVKRWNIVNVTRQQTLAEHLFNVAMISDSILNVLHMQEYRDITLAWALCHDIPEVVCGDTPTPTKNRMRKNGFDMEKIYDDIDPTYKETKETAQELLGGIPWKMVKAADYIEAMHFLTENGVGRHAKDVCNSLYNRFFGFLHENFNEHQSKGIIDVYNSIMVGEIYE